MGNRVFSLLSFSTMADVKNAAWTVPVVANGKLYVRYLQRLVCYDLLP
ncbi:MAG: hypothetical protein ABIF71_09155 [Planctomycetota bacterium]